MNGNYKLYKNVHFEKAYFIVQEIMISQTDVTVIVYRKYDLVQIFKGDRESRHARTHTHTPHSRAHML